jgi:hypothetical protein
MDPRTEQFNEAKRELMEASAALGHALFLHSYQGEHARFLCRRCGCFGAIELKPSPHICDHTDSNVYPCADENDIQTGDAARDDQIRKALERVMGVSLTEMKIQDN